MKKSLPLISDKSKASFIQVLLSVAASMIGVQSDKNRQFDFEQTSFLPYLIVGVLFVLGFVLGLIGLVKLILS